MRFTESLAQEWAPFGIRVNAVAPGSFPDPEQMSAEAYRQREANAAKSIPLGRVGRLKEVGYLAVFLALLAACGKSEGPAAPPPMDVQVVDVVQKDVPVVQEWIGTLTGYINAVIRPQVKGYLLAKVYDEGSVVSVNQLLFQIDPREFQAQLDQWKGALAQAQAALVKTQLDVARYTPLAAEGAVSQQELDNAVQANQANLAWEDAQPGLVAGMSRSIGGIF